MVEGDFSLDETQVDMPSVLRWHDDTREGQSPNFGSPGAGTARPAPSALSGTRLRPQQGRPPSPGGLLGLPTRPRSCWRRGADSSGAAGAATPAYLKIPWLERGPSRAFEEAGVGPNGRLLGLQAALSPHPRNDRTLRGGTAAGALLRAGGERCLTIWEFGAFMAI